MIATIVLGVSAAIAIYYLFIRQRIRWPPGPRGLPYIRNALQLDPAVHLTLSTWADKFGDIFRIRLFGKNIVVLSGAEMIHDAMVTYTNQFAGRPYVFRYNFIFCDENGEKGDNIVSGTYSSRWAQLKKVTMNGMKMYGEGLTKLEIITLQVLEEVMEKFTAMDGNSFDPSPTIIEAVTNIICILVFGNRLPSSLLEEYILHEKQGEEISHPRGPGAELDLFPWLRFFPNKNFKYLQAFKIRSNNIGGILVANAESDEGDGSSSLLEQLRHHQSTLLDDQGRPLLDDHIIQNQVHQIAFAGSSTTFATMKGFIAICANYPIMQQHLQAQIDNAIGQHTPTLSDRGLLPLVEATILETLRYLSITPILIPHETMCDVEFHGFSIPKGTQVWLNVWHVHHDPRYWNEPWTFKPERFLDEEGKFLPPEHPNRRRVVAFGAGRRVCLGEAIAKNRLFLFITSLLQKFTILPAEDAPPPGCDPRRFEQSLVIRPEDYKIRMIPRGNPVAAK